MGIAGGRAVSLAMALLLGACGGDGGPHALDDYLARLARPLGATPDPEYSTPAVPPRTGALNLPIAADALDGLDFLRLRGCALQATVARRNSSLGRVAPPSQRLLLELAFLREAPPCIAKLSQEGEEELAQLLRLAVRNKTAQLPALIYNATLASAEFRDFWRATSLPRDYPEHTSSLVVTALEQIVEDSQRWLAGDYGADERRLELALSTVARGDGGELLRALLVQRNVLAEGDELIREHLADGPLCQEGLRPRAAEILRTVARKYFVGRVQTWSASVGKRFHDMSPAISELEGALAEVLPAPYQDWQQTRDQILSDGMAAPAQHVTQLQALLGSCYSEFAPEPSGQQHDSRRQKTAVEA